MNNKVMQFIMQQCLASYFREGHRVVVYLENGILQYDIVSYFKQLGNVLLDTAIDLPPNTNYPTQKRKARSLFFNDIIEQKIEQQMFDIIMFNLLKGEATT